MKIVINTCFGGFGLSEEAIIELHKLKCPHIKEMTEEEYFGKGSFNTKESRTQHLKFCGIPKVNGRLLLDDHRYDSDEEYKPRACKLLVKVVQKLGKKANGNHAELGIVEIPDDVDFEISEYDGIETVHEKHRSWS